MKKIEKSLNFQPHSLSAAEIKHPDRHQRMFYAIYPIHTVRQNLWELFRAWLSRAGEFADKDSLTDMLQFYELIEEFMEVTFITSRDSQ